jgi:hypothetical protein
MRRVAPGILALLTVIGACKTTSGAPGDGGSDDAPLLPAQDGNAMGCTNLGGTCVSFETPCPVLQQNTALCEDTTLICCLPEGGLILAIPDSGSGGGSEAGAVDAGSPKESGSPMEASSPPVEASTPMDAMSPVEASEPGDAGPD